ncbi:hypothetical protein FRC14_002218 [Serendipita sp. 396]|nr:hypothetical protein FRC14_002218 [Serendipita sp. 396]KAG8803482.1 hypothetical protein FRC16_005152 [Serendipita sp. 398]
MGLSLWLIPSQPLKSQIQTIINEVADAERAPKFEPHMTVVSIPCPSAIPPLQSSLMPVLTRFESLRLAFKSLFVGTSYFISVALLLHPTPALVEFQRDIVRALSQELGGEPSDKPFLPHISLYYGNISSEDRERIASAIRDKGLLDNDAGLTIGGVSSNLPDELWVVKTEGPVESWEVIEMIQF